jgi:hypothetical protein
MEASCKESKDERIVTPVTHRFGSKAAEWHCEKNAPEAAAEN